jgi:hypothetical protein
MTTLPPISYEPVDNGEGIDRSLSTLSIDLLESAMRAGEFHDRAHAERLIEFVADVEEAGHGTQLTVLALFMLGHFICEAAYKDGVMPPADWFGGDAA